MISEEFFRDRLRHLRNERKISAREMSLALGQNESYINKIETGKSSTTIASFLNICEYLSVSPSDFFNENVSNSANVQEIIPYFQRLTPHQAEYMRDFIKDLSAGN